jgi:hypothetical protein
MGLHSFRRNDELKELFERMRSLGVVGEEGPKLLGVFHSCARNYATLEDLEFDSARKERLLFGLLNARITLATLRSTLTLHRMDYPGDLGRLAVPSEIAHEIAPAERLGTSGKDLHHWATKLEGSICDAIDSFGSSQFDV